MLSLAQREQLLESRSLVLDRLIDEATAIELVCQMLYLQDLDRAKPIYLLIDSFGGAVSGGLAIIDGMDRITPPVYTYCLGHAHGMAAIIVAHGAKPNRFADTDARLSLLTPFAEDERQVAAGELERTVLVLAEVIAADAGEPLDEVRNDLLRQRSFRASEALAYGLVDQVVDGAAKAFVNS